jgi:hypothetical protein
LVAGRILDRASNESNLRRKPDCFCHNFGRVAKPISQIRRDGQIGRIDNHPRMSQRLISR